MPRRPAPPLGRHGPGLRMLTHNVNGLTDYNHVHTLVSMWGRQNVGVVCLQETHLSVHSQHHTEHMLNVAAKACQTPPFTCFWAHNAQSHTAGVGILIKSTLLTDNGGPISLIGGEDAALQRWHDGRCMTLKMSWQGQHVLLCNCYLPSADPPAQKRFIEDIIHHVLRDAHMPVLMHGDFNFVEHVGLDRMHHEHHLHAGSHPDVGTSKVWQRVCGDLHDCFRLKHAHVRSFTYFKACAASRLDRWYCSSSLTQHVHQCHGVGVPAPDHRPVVLHLSPFQHIRPTQPDTMVHVRLGFLSDAGVAAGFVDLLRDRLATAPRQDHHAMLLWWPEFKRDLVVLCKHAQAAARANHAGHFQRAADTLREAQAALDQYVSSSTPANLNLALAARWRFIAASRSEGRETALRQRFKWLHAGERPSPLITRLTQPPRDHTMLEHSVTNSRTHHYMPFPNKS